MPDHGTIGSMEPIERGSRKDELDPNQLGREAEDRLERGSREEDLSDDERMDIFRNTFMQAALPTLPNIPGYHLCWVSLTNQKDTVPLRINLGYQLVKAEEVMGWRGGNITSIKSGEYEGCVNHNEMIAMKIRRELYERYMQEVHHNAPAAEDQKLVYQAERISEEGRRVGGDILGDDGLESIKSTASVRRGIFQN